MFDFSRHDFWKAKMSSHLKSLGHLVYQATTQESYPNASKYRKANALALKTLRASLNEDLYMCLLIMIRLLQFGAY